MQLVIMTMDDVNNAAQCMAFTRECTSVSEGRTSVPGSEDTEGMLTRLIKSWEY